MKPKTRYEEITEAHELLDLDQNRPLACHSNQRFGAGTDRFSVPLGYINWERNVLAATRTG